jgi:predicted N-formylglutamate amidohydrolase
MAQHSPFTLLLTCEHAGNRVPPAYRALFTPHRALLESHRGWDPGALPIARALARTTGAPLLFTGTTRLLVENNRSRHHPALFSAISRVLPAQDRRRVIDLYYTPHRQRVRETIAAALTRHHRVLHVGVHTFTPELDGEVRTADVGLLYDPRRTHERAFCLAWADSLHAADPSLRIRRNYPYKGVSDGLTTALRHEFAPARYIGIELEVNQALAASPEPRVRRAIARTLAQSLSDLL